MTQLPPFSSDPVFIAGDNRSGTTLLEVMLDSHPELVVGPELDFRDPENLGPALLRSIDLLEADDPRVQGPGVEATPPFGPAVQLIKQCHRFGVAFSELGERVRETMAETGTDLVTFEDRVTLINAIGESRRSTAGAARWGLKIQREILDHADFAALWPRARFVHVVRDGRDVAASHLRAERHLYYESIEHAARGWTELILGTRDLVADGRLFELHYERLVVDPEPILRRLLDHIGIAWSPAVLDHTAAPHDLFAHPYRHPSVEAVRQPLNTTAIGRYRKDLTARELAVFEGIARDCLVTMGYTVESTPTSETDQDGESDLRTLYG